jgi:hypothetical protein
VSGDIEASRALGLGYDVRENRHNPVVAAGSAESGTLRLFS